MSRAEKEDFAGAKIIHHRSICFRTVLKPYYQRGLIKIIMNNKYDGCLDLEAAGRTRLRWSQSEDQEEL